MFRSLRHSYLFLVVGCIWGCNPQPIDIGMIPIRCANIPQHRVSSTAFVIGDTAYILGGRNETKTAQRDLWAYCSTSDTWCYKGESPLTARVNASSCVVGGTAYVGLGWSQSIRDSTSYLQDFWAFTPITNTWERLANYPARTTDKAVCMTDGEHIYIAYGYDSKRFSRDVYEYTIATNTWHHVLDDTGDYDFPMRTMGAIGAYCGGRFFLGSGFRHDSQNFWTELTPNDHPIWIQQATIPGKGRTLAACAATSQYIYVAGGWHEGGTVTDGYLHSDLLRYAPIENRWYYCSALPQGGLENHVLFVINKTIYVGLGEQNGVAQNFLYKWIEE